MINVDDLIEWAKLNAKGRSVHALKGWIDGKDLMALATEVFDTEPFNFGTLDEFMGPQRIKLLKSLNRYPDVKYTESGFEKLNEKNSETSD